MTHLIAPAVYTSMLAPLFDAFEREALPTGATLEMHAAHGSNLALGGLS